MGGEGDMGHALSENLVHDQRLKAMFAIKVLLAIFFSLMQLVKLQRSLYLSANMPESGGMHP